MSKVRTDTSEALGRVVDVYWNLHKNCFSVRYRGRVVLHASDVLLADAKLVVNPAGRERVRREGRKNVHAFVRGRLVCVAVDCAGDLFRGWEGDGSDIARFHEGFTKLVQVTYNPHLHESFVEREAQSHPVYSAPWVVGNTYNGRPRLAVAE